MTLLDFEMGFNITNHMIPTGSWKIRHISNACCARVKSILMEELLIPDQTRFIPPKDLFFNFRHRLSVTCFPQTSRGLSDAITGW